jgi:hypothetical protein
MFADTHKIIVTNMYENINDIYNIELNKDSLLWGSVLPDILPRYKFHRHYEKESLDYIVNEIVKLIFISRFLEFDSKTDPIKIKLLSKKIGIISHYLSDFVCQPHAERWTFTTSMFKHIDYEAKLNEYAHGHDFKKNIIEIEDIDIFQNRIIKLKPMVKEYIENVIIEYSREKSFISDLDYALSLNLKISYFIIDTISVYSKKVSRDFAFEF